MVSKKELEETRQEYADGYAKHDGLIHCNRAKIAHLEEVLNKHAEEFEKLSNKLNILIDLHKAELLEKQAKEYEEKAKTLRTTAKNLSKND